ncbi:MAG: hypothetical protein A3E01_00135 [Gammaproteobacteria bacterium RIFCSPHIGHO2_12_FULL_63_22]|nr:MAG: hypothetical protein A3E01_00135 [Gammaproteobacteria bacterium RIFCSPHIGHO2_12_FULL_63_22]
MNNWCFTGNLGNDAEQKFVPNGDSVVSFSVAVKSGYGDKATTTWARCQIWGKRGESVLPYLTKGKLVGVTGELSSREYQKDGQTKTSIEVRVNDLTLLEKREGGQAAAPRSPEQRTPAEPSPQKPASGPGSFSDFDDDIPF